MGLIDNTPTGQLVFTIFSAFAQFERDMIVTRTQKVNCMPSNMIRCFGKGDRKRILMNRSDLLMSCENKA
ncbi:recombinase family protein [Lactiplantibacillus plantarum]|uniref:recombinase family protein n=1 Tax=Lactiplantibacillus plantarum TaxID=1590 RepID=UPI00374E21D2